MSPSPPPGPTPRRSKPSLASRLRTYWIVLTVAAIVLIGGGKLLSRAPIFDAQTPRVTGNAHVATADVLARAGLDPHANVWLVNARAIERRIEALPYVGTAHLHRGFPGGASIEISERKPDGCVRSDVATATLDADQRVLQLGCVATTVYLLRSAADFTPGAFLRDTTLSRLQADAVALDASGRRLNELGMDRYGELEASLPDGIRVRFGDDADLAAKKRLIGPILAALGPRVVTVSAIDLRAPTTPVVEHRPPAGQPRKSSPQPIDTI